MTEKPKNRPFMGLMLFAVCVFVTILVGCVNVQDTKNGAASGNASDQPDADTRIGELVNSDEFARMDISERSEKARRLLEELQSEGLISNVYYDEGNSQYAYSYSDGSAGSISLERFRSDMN